jgi:hypothetical protein
MDAKKMMLEYAAKHNDGKTYTDEQFCGKMVTEGVRINSQDAGTTIAKASRKGQVIVITETRTINTVAGKQTTTTDAVRIEL